MAQFNNGERILIKQNGLSTKEVFEYLSLKNDDTLSSIEVENKDEAVSKSVGVLINKDADGVINTTQINVEDYNNPKEVDNAIKFAIDSNLNQRVKELHLRDVIKDFVTLKEVQAVTLEWEPVRVKSFVDYGKNATVQSSTSLQKYGTKPDNSGNYYTLHKVSVDFVPRNYFCAISDVQLVQSGNGGGQIYEYGPKNTSNSKEFSICLPWGISYPFNTGSTTTSKVVGGGIGSSYIHQDFKLSTPTNKRYSVQSVIEMYQNKKNSRIYPNFFESKLTYYYTIAGQTFSKTILISGY